jgi:hypothetical protein
MNPHEMAQALTRRTFLTHSTTCLGSAALAGLLRRDLFAAAPPDGARASYGALPRLHFAPRAKQVIYLFMSGGPSHLDLFDPKPLLTKRTGEDLPPSVRMGQRITGMTSGQARLQMVGPAHPFVRAGKVGVEIASILPHTAKVIDDICLVRSLHVEPINHDPAVTFLLTGNQQPGRPTVGAWVAYGLGSANRNLPEYVALLSGNGGQPLLARYWGNGFLPGRFQGVQFRSTGDPVLHVSNPPGIDAKARRELLDGVEALNRLRLGDVGDPEIATRISAYEMAYRMQTSVPELMDIGREPARVREMYGAELGQASFANNCLLARRLTERGVRFVQLYHRDWDHHGALYGEIKKQCDQTDRPAAALVADLKQRGLLDETLVIWGGEFGRTAYSQGNIAPKQFGRDHHPRCFSVWLAGGGVRGGQVIGRTDDFGYNVVEDAIDAHDFQATILHLLGVDHKKLTFRYQGRDYRLTDVRGNVVKKLLA